VNITSLSVLKIKTSLRLQVFSSMTFSLKIRFSQNLVNQYQSIKI